MEIACCSFYTFIVNGDLSFNGGQMVEVTHSLRLKLLD